MADTVEEPQEKSSWWGGIKKVGSGIYMVGSGISTAIRISKGAVVLYALSTVAGVTPITVGTAIIATAIL